MHLPQVQYTMPTSQYKDQPGHCIFEEISHNLKYSVLPMLVINSFDFFAERIEFLSLVRILHQRVTVRVSLELLKQSFYNFLATRVFLLNC